MRQPAFGVREVRIRRFRSAWAVGFAPGPVCALVGGPSVGKSNVLEAVWTLLQRGASPPAVSDVSAGSTEGIELSATLSGGDEITLRARPPAPTSGAGPLVPVLFLPAALRSSVLTARPTGTPTATRVADTYLTAAEGRSPAASAAALVDGVGRLCADGEQGVVVLIEEPELFLTPQAQRYLYRRLREFAERGKQVLYSTHEPTFLNVARLDEVALVEQSSQGTIVIQPDPLGADESFRALSELDAERAELFLARAVLLVEGRTEKLTFPFVFRALGYDADREAITIVDCGGKPNIPLFIRICHAARIPCVAVHDRDAPAGRRPSHAERMINAQIARLAGPERTVELAPDLEAVAGLRSHRHKPAHAWRRFSAIEPGQVPRSLAGAVQKVVALARS